MPALISSAAPDNKDAVEAQWLPLANIPGGGRQEHAAVVLNSNTIGIVGGVTLDASAVTAPFASTDLVQLYSISENTWRTATRLPRPLNHPNAIGLDNKIYVFGGFDDGGDTRKILHSVNASWVYDSTSDTWNSLPPPSPSRAQAALAVHGDKIYVIGGFTDLVISEQLPLPATLTHVSVFDTTTSSWITEDFLPELARHIPSGVDHARAEVVNDTLLFILDLLDLAAGWKEGASMPTPRATFGAGVIGNKIVTIGGEGNATSAAEIPLRLFNEVEVYDTVTDSWVSWGTLPVKEKGRQGPGVSVGGKIYIAGGNDTAPVGPLDRLDVYVPGDVWIWRAIGVDCDVCIFKWDSRMFGPE
ncbi:hypothetical protein CBER1_09150 [Cercospora berteroae]|uniref:PLD phosphodiesterase domain-containing protein n=1 Tax=Cercospora berteroae TaxID=357750 RepID=A0A2S6BVF2_9PEZI|nr:hypothetical protein CBER1_09150 [Cercospora berteroae]